MKKTIIIIIGAIIIIGITILIFILKDQKAKSLNTERGIKKLYNEKAFSPFYVKDNIYYIDDQNFYIHKLDIQNNQDSIINKSAFLASKNITNLNILWNGKDQNLFLIYIEESINELSGEGTQIKWYLGKLSDNNFKELPLSHISDLDWKDKDSISYIDIDNRIKTLNINNFNKTTNKDILEIDASDVFVSNSGNKAIICETLEGEITSSSIFLYNFNIDKIEKLQQNYLRSPLWSPSDTKILFNKYDATSKEISGMYLWSPDKEIDLKIGTTLKTIWEGESSIITAISRAKNQDYDDLYRINTETGEKTLLFQSTNKEHYSASNLMISDDGKTLYFTSDDYLYKMDIPE